MPQYSAADIIQIITALSSFITVIGGTWIAIKQVGISKKVSEATRKVDEAKVAAQGAAEKLAESTEVRALQIKDLKETVIAKVDELKNGPPGSTGGPKP